jgi:hypothetical protein
LSTGRHPRDSGERLNLPLPPATTSSGPNSRFLEMTRNSGTFSYKRFSLGQRVRIDSMGKYIPDPSPASEHSNPLSTAGSASLRTGDPPTPPSLNPHPIQRANQHRHPSHIAAPQLPSFLQQAILPQVTQPANSTSPSSNPAQITEHPYTPLVHLRISNQHVHPMISSLPLYTSPLHRLVNFIVILGFIGLS